MSRRKETSAGIIPIYVDGSELSILTVKARTGDWEFPKGGVEGDEELQQTAIRETKEELGVDDIRILDGFSKSYSYEFYWDGSLVDKTVHLFAAELFERAISLSSEHSQFKWLPPNEAREQLSHSGMRNALDDALDHINNERILKH